MAGDLGAHGRFATAEECAPVVLFLACTDSTAMTGQALNGTAGVIMSEPA